MAHTSLPRVKNSSNIKDLLLLFAIPVVIVIFAVLAVNVPQLLANPTYDFIYSSCDDYECRNSYSIDSLGRIKEETQTKANQDYYNGVARLRYYDASSDSTRIITVAEANRYSLNTSSKSPDGYILKSGTTANGMIFFGSTDNSWYLKSGIKSKKVDLSNNRPYYSSDIELLGWVKK